MHLALRTTPAAHANWAARLAAWAIKARTVSQYCHAGVVVDGALSHATPAKGLHSLAAGDWQPDNWVLIDCGNSSSHRALVSVGLWLHHPVQYDWLSLLAFVGIRARDSRRMYCYEWCWYCLTGELPTTRITCEMLIYQAYQLKLQETQP